MNPEKLQVGQIRHLCVVIPGVLLISSLILIGSAQSQMPDTDSDGRWVNGITEPWSFRSDAYLEAEASEARTRWKTIGDARNNIDEWAGDYRSGDLHGNFLRWSPKNGFVLFQVFTCEANVTDLQFGSVSFFSGLIQLNPERRPKAPAHASGMHDHGRLGSEFPRLVPVKWGSDRYLVPTSQIALFGEYLAGVGRFGGSDRGSKELDYYWNSVDNQVDLFAAAPVFPSGYEKFMRLPIVARVTSVGRSYVRLDQQDEWWNDLVVPVTIDVGRKEGAKAGMGLYIVNSEENETVELTQVGLHSSKGFIKRFIRKKPGVRVNQWDDGAPVKWAPIQIGSRVSSSQIQILSLRTPA